MNAADAELCEKCGEPAEIPARFAFSGQVLCGSCKEQKAMRDRDDAMITNKYGHVYGTKLTLRIEPPHKIAIDMEDALRQVMTVIVDTRERMIRDGLIALGWTPPKEPNPLVQTSFDPNRNAIPNPAGVGLT